MARSVGAALSEGLDTGFRMAMDIDAREEDKRRARMREERDERRFNAEQEDRLATRARLDRQEKRLLDQDALNLDKTALSALDEELKTHAGYGAKLYEQYGDQIPDDVRQPYVTKGRQLIEQRGALRRKLYEPRIRELEQESANTWSRIEAGQMNIEDLKPVDLVRTLTVAAKRDLSDFLAGPDGAPSRVSQAGLDLVAGMETGNEALVLEAANILLEPELKRGVGEPGKDGSTITGKEIVKFIPHPQNPNEVLPVIRVHVKREDGKVGSYLAPITKNRSADPDDEVIGLDIGKAMDRAGRLITLAETLNAPGMRERVDQGMQEGGKETREFLDIFFGVGGEKPKAKVEWKSVPAGGMLVGLDEKGRQVGEVRGPARSTGLQASLDAINGMVDRGEIDEQTADDLRRAAARSAALGKRGAGGGGRGISQRADQLPRDLTGEALLARLSEDDATVVVGLADGSIRPTDISTRDNRRERLIALAKRYDPTADFGPDGRLKDVPTAAQKAMLENSTNMRRAQRALRLMGEGQALPGETPDKDATGLKGFVPNLLLNRLDPKGVEARAAIADLGSLVIHERSGAAVTAAEFPRLAPFIPTEKDDPETARKKLRRFIQVYQEEMNALQTAYSREAGYKPFNVKDPAANGRASSTTAKDSKTVTIGGRAMTATRAPDGKYYVRLQNGRYAEVRE